MPPKRIARPKKPKAPPKTRGTARPETTFRKSLIEKTAAILMERNDAGDFHPQAAKRAIAEAMAYRGKAKNVAQTIVKFYNDVMEKLKENPECMDEDWEPYVRPYIEPHLKSDADKDKFEAYLKLPPDELYKVRSKKNKNAFPDSPRASELWLHDEYSPLLPHLRSFKLPAKVYADAKEEAKASQKQSAENETWLYTKAELLTFLLFAVAEVTNPTNPWFTVIALLLLTGRRRACIVAGKNAPEFDVVPGKPYQFYMSHSSKAGFEPKHLPCVGVEGKHVVAAVKFVRETPWPVKRHKDREEIVSAKKSNVIQWQRRAKAFWNGGDAPVEGSTKQLPYQYNVMRSLFAHLAFADRERNKLMPVRCNRTAFYKNALGHDNAQSQQHYDRILVVADDAARNKILNGAQSAGESPGTHIMKLVDKGDMEEELKEVLEAAEVTPPTPVVPLVDYSSEEEDGDDDEGNDEDDTDSDGEPPQKKPRAK